MRHLPSPLKMERSIGTTVGVISTKVRAVAALLPLYIFCTFCNKYLRLRSDVARMETFREERI